MNETETQQMSGAELESVIKRALDKVDGKKENDLCRYLPGENGGYLHHFTLRKMKKKEPAKLQTMIGSHILGDSTPAMLPPKPRRPRGSQKRRESLLLDEDLKGKLISIARRHGEYDVLHRLLPPKALPQLRKELVQSIRQGHVNQQLWDQYAEATRLQQEQKNG